MRVTYSMASWLCRRARNPLGPLVLALIAGGGLSACGSLAAPSLSSTAQRLTPPVVAATATPSPIPFTFTTVDDPSSTINAVTGMDQSANIVGNIGNGSASNPLESYYSAPPYSSFELVEYSGAVGTGVTSLYSSATKTILAGYVVLPPTLKGTWGAVNVNGLWALSKDRKAGKNGVTEFLGINASEMAVGFYISSGTDVPFVVNVGTGKFTVLKPPGTNGAQATGVNKFGDIALWGSTTGGATGFLLKTGSYYSFSYPNVKTTEALGLNSQDQIVGYYKDSNGKKHGFILTGPTNSPNEQVWQTIDDPKAASGTVVTGVNDADDICGYYVDADGVQHGFVAIPGAS
jgi:hypothetical protein